MYENRYMFRQLNPCKKLVLNPTYTILKEINEREKKFNPAKYIRSEDILHWEEYIAILTGHDNILH